MFGAIIWLSVKKKLNMSQMRQNERKEASKNVATKKQNSFYVQVRT